MAYYECENGHQRDDCTPSDTCVECGAPVSLCLGRRDIRERRS